MTPPTDETIFALASGAGRAALAVMRVSGPGAGAVLDGLCGTRPAPRRASLRALRDRDGEVLDRALVLWMPGPASYAGEDAAELHLHAGPAIIDGVADALVRLGARPAEPGEFTRRAFLNGRMDLLEAEAVADLVAAETASQRRQALRQLGGSLGEVFADWAARLRRLLAEQEALIDFPDEDLPADTEAAMLDALTALDQDLRRHLAEGQGGERLRAGLIFAVSGPPNVGKSSLVNALAGRDIAIVAASPGTTRDALETRVVLGGVPVTLVDTAGLRETADPVEAEGVRRARERVRAADLVIAVASAGCVAPHWEAGGGAVRVLNKIDLARACEGVSVGGAIPVSAMNGRGLDRLRTELAGHACRLTASSGPAPLTRARHRAALNEAAECIGRARAAPLPELRAEDLRLALRALGRVTGHVGVEDLLDTIFRQFCIGK